jgi:Putative peptidoglycan binding domain
MFRWDGFGRFERARTAIPWGKLLHAYFAGSAGFYRRICNAQSVVAATSHLRRLFTPANLGIVGSFLFCFVILITPPQFYSKPPIAAGSPSAGGEYTFEMTNTKSFERATKQMAVLAASSNEGFDRDLEKAESARVLTGGALQVKEEPQSDMAKRNLFNRGHVKEVQQRLIQLGYLSVSATGMWGPLSRNALRAFKADHDLTADENWDEATERRLFSRDVEQAEAFVGIWGIEASACSPRLNRKGFLPAVIDGEGAWAGETFCAFERKKRIAGGWDVVANCSNTHDRWSANVRLIINGDQLTWTSERGSVSYLRCQPGLGAARSL